MNLRIGNYQGAIDAASPGDTIHVRNGTLLQGFSAINSSGTGIKVSSHNNIIVANVASHNDYAGIGLESFYNNIVSENAFLQNGVFGVVLRKGVEPEQHQRKYAN